MSIHVACTTCDQPWTVVLGSKKAHPGKVESGRFRFDGESQAVTIAAVSDAENEASWSCLCGNALTHRYPRLYSVPCIHDAQPGGVCRVRDHQRRALPGLVPAGNPRGPIVGACPCCCHQGLHFIRWGETTGCGATPTPTA